MSVDEAVREKHLLDLFIHPGWKLLIEEMTQAHEVLVETAFTVKSERELYQRKGEIQILSELLSYEDLYKMQMNEQTTD